MNILQIKTYEIRTKSYREKTHELCILIKKKKYKEIQFSIQEIRKIPK